MNLNFLFVKYNLVDKYSLITKCYDQENSVMETFNKLRT
jgi:hypothetical protein